MSIPSIVFSSFFRTFNSVMENKETLRYDDYIGYIDYMDREEARKEETLKDYDGYNDYMGNPNKNGSLFTKHKNGLNEKEIKKVKNLFKVAQNKKSNLWQDVFSFDNKWLEKQGLYLRTLKGDDVVTKRMKRLSLFRFYNENKEVYVIWNNSSEALKVILDNKMFSKEVFKRRKVPINSISYKVLVSIDYGKNYIYLNRALKRLDGKLNEPYILSDKYVIR